MDSRRRCFDFEVEQNRDLALSAPKPAELEVFQYYEKGFYSVLLLIINNQTKIIC